MVVHTVMWKFKDDLDRTASYRELKADLEALIGKVPGLLSIDFGLNINPSDAAWDITLRSSHDDPQALEDYRVHPDHVKIGAKIASFTKDRAVVDYQA